METHRRRPTYYAAATLAICSILNAGCDSSPTAPINSLGVVAVAVAPDHTCAATADGRLFCWGDDTRGQLGDGRGDCESYLGWEGCSRQARQVEIDERVVAVDGNRWYTCALTESGRIYCWGDNTGNKLGVGPVDEYCQVPNNVEVRTDAFRGYQCSPFPVEVAQPGGRWQGVTVGLTAACGLSADGVGYCWGTGPNGELGSGLGTSAMPTPLGGDLRFQEIHLSQNYNWQWQGSHGQFGCGVSTEGRVYCWGEDNNGQLGRGPDGGASSTPVPVEAPEPLTSVSLGSRHACGLTGDGTAYCWGSNQVGQIGDGEAGVTRGTPVPVNTSLRFEEISAGVLHTCGIAAGGRAYCWGGPYGTGNGSQARALTPMQVPSTKTFLSIAAGDSYTCSVSTGRELYCWGENRHERITAGGGHRISTPVFIRVPGDASVDPTTLHVGSGFPVPATVDGGLGLPE